MKKILLLITAIIISSSVLYAQDAGTDKVVIPREKNVFTNPSDNEFMGKIGFGYAADPEKFGLDISLNYIFNLDPVFVFGLEGDFFWIKWKNELGDVDAGGSAGGSEVATTDLYTFPLFANATVRLPFLRQKIYVEPSVTVGLGYSFMILDYSSDTENGTDLYSGFAWQVLGSLSYKIFQNSAVDFVFDFGYRSLDLEQDRVSIDMSGIITRLGVRMYI